MSQGSKIGALRYAVDERPPLGLCAALGIQQALLMLNSIVLIPVVLGKSAGFSPETVGQVCFAAILASAASSLVQVVRVYRVGSGLPMYLGSSGLYLGAAMVAAKAGGMPLVAAMTLFSACSAILLSFFLRHFRYVLSPALGGAILMIVSIDLMPLAFDLWEGGAGSPLRGSGEHLLVGLITVLAMVLLGLLGGRTLRLWSPLLALFSGFSCAWGLGLVDFSGPAAASVFGLPGGGHPGLDLAGVLAHPDILGAFLVSAAMGAILTVGASMAAQKISRRDFRDVDFNQVQGAVLADAAGKVVAGVLGAVPNIVYTDQVAVMEMTGVASRRVAYFVVGALFLMAFMPVVPALVMAVPEPVFGGFLFVLLGLILYSGLSLAFSDGVNHKSGLMVGVSLGVAMLAERTSFFPGLSLDVLAPLARSGIAAGGVAALCLSVLMHHAPRRKAKIRLDATPEGLRRFLAWFDDQTGRLALSRRQTFMARLACEETFLHVIGQAGAEKRPQRLRCTLKTREHGVFVEMHTLGEVERLTPTGQIAPGQELSETRLAELGLALLAKTARNIRHFFISGHTYISFVIAE